MTVRSIVRDVFTVGSKVEDDRSDSDWGSRCQIRFSRGNAGTAHSQHTRAERIMSIRECGAAWNVRHEYLVNPRIEDEFRFAKLTIQDDGFAGERHGASITRHLVG